MLLLMMGIAFIPLIAGAVIGRAMVGIAVTIPVFVHIALNSDHTVMMSIGILAILVLVFKTAEQSRDLVVGRGGPR